LGKRKRVVFLMSDTGAGHRAAANAIQAAMEARYPDQYGFELVDVYRGYTPFPFNHMPEIYPPWVNYARRSWEFAYKFVNTHRRGRLFMAFVKRYWRDGIHQFVIDHPADVVVSVTVITDLVTTHAFWYERDVERCLVPTQAAYDRGCAFGLRPDQLRITGLPIHPQFVDGLLPKDAARRKLGWDAVRPAVLLIGGGEGMGPVYAAAEAINRRGLDIQLIVVAGRNRALLRQLEAVRWNQSTRIYPFVSNMPELMAAADMLVTKAGPATICEACIAGLPMVLSSAVPGQEEGNIAYVVQNHAGVYAPGADRVAEAVTDWLGAGTRELACRAQWARTLARPDAVWTVADEIHAQAQKTPVRTRFRTAPPRRLLRSTASPKTGG
jgi:1,2-diacylglycerol 3-beta-galactosyltransferase